MIRPARFAALAAFAVLVSASPAFARGIASGGAAPVPGPAKPCVAVTFKATSGYRPSSSSSIGAVWASYSVKNCGTAPITVQVALAESVVDQPDLAFGWNPLVTIDPNKSWTVANLDNDNAPLAATYSVELSVSDAADGSVLYTNHVSTTTPIDKSGVGVSA